MASILEKHRQIHPHHSHHHRHHNYSSLIRSRLATVFILCLIVTSVPSYMFLKYYNYNGKSSSSLRSSTLKDDLSVRKDGSMKDEGLNFEGHDHSNLKDLIPDKEVLGGATIMPKMANATAKAELGRATWKFMHTLTARFPEHPTEDERAALKSFLYLFSRLYPCGDCARHFQALLKQYPPQTSSRNAASLHLCSLHNLVNERLKKPQYNCTTLAENYDCGCGHDEEDEKKKKKKNTTPISPFNP